MLVKPNRLKPQTTTLCVLQGIFFLTQLLYWLFCGQKNLTTGTKALPRYDTYSET